MWQAGTKVTMGKAQAVDETNNPMLEVGGEHAPFAQLAVELAGIDAADSPPQQQERVVTGGAHPVVALSLQRLSVEEERVQLALHTLLPFSITLPFQRKGKRQR